MFIFVFIVLYFIFLRDETNCLVELKFSADFEEKCQKSIFLYLKPGSQKNLDSMQQEGFKDLGI